MYVYLYLISQVSGLHVWFPENQALAYGCTAFLNTGYSNRYDGCYIDGSVAVFANPSDTTWIDGFVLGGAGFKLTGKTASNFVLSNTVMRGCLHQPGKCIAVDPGMKASNVWIGRNPNSAQGSAVTKSVASAAAESTYTFDFCSELVFDTIEIVKSVTFSSLKENDGVFPVLTVGKARACPGGAATTAMRVVDVHLSVAAAGTITLTVDSSTQTV